MSKPIYLDNAATTPIDPQVLQVMQEFMQSTYGNPASMTHAYGAEAQKAVEHAREQVAQVINAQAREVVFTSGATEADNLAIKGVAQFHQRRGKHIVTMQTEHKAVLETCEFLEAQGFEVTYLAPETDGLLNLEKFKQALRDDTILTSIMHVNNETGVIQDIKAIGQITREKGILLHVDAAQSVGKAELDVKNMKIDLLSVSGHKAYGPKGVGALYLCSSPKVRLQPQVHGGGHEIGMRAGTLATHQIIGLGQAFALAYERFEKDKQHLQALNQQFVQGLQRIDGVVTHGQAEARVPGILSVSFDKVAGESLLLALSDIAVATGSACTSARMSTSHVLRAMNVPVPLQHSALRFSMGRFTTEQEVNAAIDIVTKGVDHLRRISPF